MIRARLALLLAALLPLAAPAASHRWSPLAPGEGSTGSLLAPRLQVGVVRPAPKDLPALAWTAEGASSVARFDATSEGSLGLRSRLVLDGTGPLELRVRGADGRVETMAIPAGETEAWGPWTPGETQALEVRSDDGPRGTVRLGGVVHFDRPLEGKAAAACTLDAVCTTGNPSLDAAIAERKKSLGRMVFVDGGISYVCTGTLVESARAGESYFLTANHCIPTQAVASTLSTRWFYENGTCGAGPVNPASVQTSGGMDVVFADPNTDMTLLRLRAAPPAGVTYARLDATPFVQGEAVTSLSHPDGDVAKWAQATIAGQGRFDDWPQAAWLTTFTRGIIQGGSSGSGLFTLAPDGTLVLRSTLSASTLTNGNGLSCTNTGENGVYNRLDVFLPEAAQYLSAAGPQPDDHGNRPSEATPVSLPASGPVSVAGRIDYRGDVDVFRIPVTQKGVLIVRATSGIDTVGRLLDSEGAGLDVNDDAQTTGLDFGLTSSVTAGTYYVAVSHWESDGTGAYQLSFEFQPIGDNHTDLWWNASESGWGININQQSNIVFATLFTYGADGSPLWLVMSEGRPQPDGSFAGTLYRAAGPPFGANPWSPSAVSISPVGTLAVAFTGADSATLRYTVDGVAVTKGIVRQQFSTPATTCRWSVFDRSFTFNYQDLWWKPTESGWGINFTQQGSVLFATLFDYDEQGRNAWYAMTNGARVPGGTDRWTGALYRFTGPRFDAQPWAPVTPRQVGTLTVDFTAGNAATLSYTINGIAVTKSIQRQEFAPLRPDCEAVSED